MNSKSILPIAPVASGSVGQGPEEGEGIGTLKAPSVNQSEMNRRRYAFAFLAVLCVLYLLQMFTPLRLFTDSISYLSLAASFVDGHGFLYDGSPTHFPHGYPAMIALLDKLGLAGSWSFVGLNCLFIAAGLLASWVIFRRVHGFTPAGTALCLCFTLLSFALIKHMSIPLSEAPFLGVSMTCLSLLVLSGSSTGVRRWLMIGSAAALAFFAIKIRMAGVALLPALVWVCLSGKRWQQLLPGRKPKIRLTFVLIGSFSLLALLTLAWFISHTRYFRADIIPEYGQTSLVNRVASNAVMLLSEWGELFANLPASKAPAIAQSILPLVGVPVLVAIVAALWLRRHQLTVVDCYFVSYATMLFLYPYYDTRLWVPVLPLLVGYMGLAYQQGWRLRGVPAVAVLHSMWFILLGAAALAYSTRITFAGPRFSQLYGDGTLRATYEYAFLGARDTNNVNPDALMLLNRYGNAESFRKRHAE